MSTGAVEQDSEDDGGIISEINITPMVDIMLVLLIIFMVTAPAMFTPGIELEMPEAKTAEVVAQQEMGLLIDRDGGLYLNGKLIDYTQLETNINELLTDGKEPVVLVGADQLTPHKYVVQALDFLRDKGVFKFAIQTQAPQGFSADEDSKRTDDQQAP